MPINSGRRRRPFVFPLAVTGLVAAVLLAMAAFAAGPEILRSLGFLRIAAAGTQVVPAPNPQTPASDEETTVRLNFFKSTWPTVLKKVARATGSDLVMERTPSGRFTRGDRKQYSRIDAVHLLNRVLEPKGFRLLIQGKYLIVLPLESLRSRYRRPTVSSPKTSKSPTKNTTDRPGVHSIKGHAAASGSRTSKMQTDRPDTNIRLAEYSTTEGPRAPRRHAIAEPFPDRDSRGHRLTGGDDTASPTAGGNHPVIVVNTPRHGARDVARVIYAALKHRSELVDEGPQRLPSFRVYRTSRLASDRSRATATRRNTRRRSTTTPQFTIGLDLEHNALLVAAPVKQHGPIADLIRLIDAAQMSRDRDVQLVSAPASTTALAQRLAPILRLMAARQQRGTSLAASRRQPAGSDRSGTTTTSALQPKKKKNRATDTDPRRPATPPNNDGQPVPAKRPAATKDGEPLLKLEGLRGPVTIRDIPGIGMVVTGNPRDVQTVVSIIRELQRLATGALPNIHLLQLRNVNSEALASLLNDVYGELTSIQSVATGQQPQVAVIPVVQPNAILIIASPADLKSILELANQLDQPVNPRSEFEVFALKHAIASHVVTTLEGLYGRTQQQQQQPAGLRGQIKVVADARTNSVIVQAAPLDLAAISMLIRKIDRDSSDTVSRIQVFPLKNAVADELAEVINSAIQSVLLPPTTTGRTGPTQGGQAGGGQAAQQLRDAKSTVLEFLTTKGQRTIRSGILADIRVTADPRVNSLIVTAPEQSMPLLAELIRQLDQPTSNVAEIKVFALTNGDATGMAQLLENLFNSQNQQSQQAQLGIQVAGAGDASSGLIPLRFSVDVRTNSIIAIGGAEALRVVEAILLRLDESDVRQRKNIVIKLKNSPATEVAGSINQFLQSQRDLAQIDPNLVSNVELLEREIIVVPEAISNSLLVSATPRYYQEILDMIEQLDKAPAQVIIQVLIVEVELQNTDEFGVELGFQDSALFDRGLLNLDNFRTITQSFSTPGTGVVTTTEQIVNQETVPGFLFNNNQLGNNTVINPAAVGTQGLSNFSLGRVNGDLGFGGLVLSASSEAVSVLIRALSAHRNVQILSRPQIRTLDNQLASIQVGQQVPVISGATTNAAGGITPVLGTPQQVGIILQVTPRITPEGIIVMETIANKSSIAGQGVPIIVDPGTGAVVESPIFDLTEVRSTVSVPDGQTIVLGGMITQSNDTLERKVPWLGDIPLLGAAFRFNSTTTRRTELLIFMTPRIIRNNEDSEWIKQVEAERLHFLQEEAEEIHGPIFAVPSEHSFDLIPPKAVPKKDASPPPPPAPGATGDVPTTIMPALPLSEVAPPGRTSMRLSATPAPHPGTVTSSKGDPTQDPHVSEPAALPMAGNSTKRTAGWWSRFRFRTR